ncbi:MAG: hypothetical protein ACJ72Y_05185 [Actinomycetes bacterium]
MQRVVAPKKVEVVVAGAGSAESRWVLYPSEPRQRRVTITRDVLVVVTVAVLAWVGRRVFLLVDRLSAVTDAVGNAGSSVQDAFGSAADALSSTPVIGDELASALQTAGAQSGGNVVDLALTGDTAIHRLALALGWLTFVVPALFLLVLYIPMRIAQIRRLRASRTVYRDEHDPERRRLLAMRAAMSLPVDHLLAYTGDPIGDLVRGDLDALVEALLADAGLAPAATPAP